MNITNKYVYLRSADTVVVTCSSIVKIQSSKSSYHKFLNHKCIKLIMVHMPNHTLKNQYDQ